MAGRAGKHLTASTASGEGAAAAASLALQDGTVGLGCALCGSADDGVPCCHQAKGAGAPELEPVAVFSHRLAWGGDAAGVALYENPWLHSFGKLWGALKVAAVGFGLGATGRRGRRFSLQDQCRMPTG